jgi:hypothetical protein
MVVTGKVTDGNGESVIGASVAVKGTTKGASTDVSGNFKIEVPNSSTVLVVSFVGYDTQEIMVGNKTNFKR